MPEGRRFRGPSCLALLLTLAIVTVTGSASAATLTIYSDEPAGPPLMGLGVQWDPYDSFRPTPASWQLTFARLDYMRPGFIRVIEPASDYFRGYDSSHNPTYRWSSPHVVELLTILGYAKSRGITVELGDWGNPMLGGDVRIPAEFLARLHDTYGYTNIRYYNLTNEPNYASDCDFVCWTDEVTQLSAEFTALGMNSWLQLVGPDNGNSWDDTPDVLARDRTAGLDGDNPIGGDVWLTDTLGAIPSLIRAYDSHRYSTPQGLAAGVYQLQMYSRREQISNRDSSTKPYFEGEAGLAARVASPFSARDVREGRRADPRVLAPLLDPSARARASTFVDSQPRIREFGYGVWMGDMAVQAMSAGLSGASAWNLDDAMHVGGQYGSHNLKQWGFWNSYGGQDGYPASDLRLRPWFYTWSVLARSFPVRSQGLVVPGTRIAGLRVAAAKVPSEQGYAISLAIVNDSSTRRSITLAVPSAIRPLTLARYDYFGTDRPADADGFPVPAGVIRGVRLSAGVRVVLPSRGLVVLSSVGESAIPLLEGKHTLLDNLDSWRQTSFHTRGLKLDHSAPADFNDDRSRARAGAKTGQYLIYRARHITSFALKTYIRGSRGVRVLGSSTGKRWSVIKLAFTTPAPALGGHGWYLSELLPAGGLDAQTNQLKIEFSDQHTELSQVVIERR